MLKKRKVLLSNLLKFGLKVFRLFLLRQEGQMVLNRPPAFCLKLTFGIC